MSGDLGGRPTVKGGRERSIQKNLRIDEKEARKLEKRMREAGEVSFSAYARRVLLGEKLVVQVDRKIPREVMRELGAIGNNLNQLAHQANTRGSALDSELEEAIEKVERLWMLLSPYKPQNSSEN